MTGTSPWRLRASGPLVHETSKYSGLTRSLLWVVDAPLNSGLECGDRQAPEVVGGTDQTADPGLAVLDDRPDVGVADGVPAEFVPRRQAVLDHCVHPWERSDERMADKDVVDQLAVAAEPPREPLLLGLRGSEVPQPQTVTDVRLGDSCAAMSSSVQSSCPRPISIRTVRAELTDRPIDPWPARCRAGVTASCHRRQTGCRP